MDGPGVRFLIFLKGCKLRCKYCHNPDTWDKKGGTLMSSDEILDMAERYRSYWGSDGGITVSGGEPLLQLEFLTELFKKAKERGINTCIDTAAQPFTREEPFFSGFNELMQYTDLLLVDIKHIDPQEHIKLTGLPGENIKDCLKYLSEIGKSVWIRHVLVPGITDKEEYLIRTREFIDTLSNVKRIEILPYHSMARVKYEELGIPYPLEGVGEPSEDEILMAEKILL